MIKMIDRKLNFENCKKSIDSLSEFLSKNCELDETGPKGL